MRMVCTPGGFVCLSAFIYFVWRGKLCLRGVYGIWDFLGCFSFSFLGISQSNLPLDFIGSNFHGGYREDKLPRALFLQATILYATRGSEINKIFNQNAEA